MPWVPSKSFWRNRLDHVQQALTPVPEKKAHIKDEERVL